MTVPRRYLILLGLFALASCGGGLSGEYADSSGLFKYNFKSGGKVEMTTMAGVIETDYRLDGDRVKVGPEGSATILSLDKDGCLDAGGFMGKLCKAK